MYRILARDTGDNDYAEVDYCNEDELADTLIKWQQQYEFVISERC